MASIPMPMFGFGCIAFLLLCVVLAVATFLVFRSGERGTTKLSAPAGCLVALALVFIAVLGAVGVGLVMIARIPTELVVHGPVKSLEWELEPARAGEALPPPTPGSGTWEARPSNGVLRIEVREGGSWRDVSGEVMQWLQERVGSDITVSVQPGPSGPTTLLEFRMQIDEGELRRLRRELREVWPTLKLPAKLRIEIRDD